MKKTKLFSAIAALLCLCMLFVACSKKPPEETPPTPTPLLEQIMSKDLQSNYLNLTTVTNLGKADDGEALGRKMYVFYEGAEDSDAYKIKVFSAITGTIVLTIDVAADAKVTYSFEEANVNSFLLYTWDIEKDEIVKTQLYNAKGEEIAAVDEYMEIVYLEDNGYMFASTHFMFNHVLYQDGSADGSVTKIADIPDYMGLPYIEAWNEQYYFGMDEYSENEVIKVYNKQFKLLYVWEAPSYAWNVNTGLLNDGRIFAQYFVELPDDAVEYDVYYDGCKCDLVTILINPADGSVEELNVNFVVEEIVSVSSYRIMVQMYSGINLNMFAEGVENIAMIHPIENKNVNYAKESRDYVLMSNKLERGASMKFVTGQDMMGIPLPSPLGNGLYAVYAENDIVILNNNAEEIARFNYTCSQLGNKYFFTDEAIYDLSTMTKVYDLKAEKATVLEKFENSLCIGVEKDDKNSEYYIWENGTKTLLATYAETNDGDVYKDANGKILKSFDLHDEFNVFVLEYEDGTFDYYSAAGKKLFTTDKELYLIDYFEVMDGLNRKEIALFGNEDGVYLFS